MCELERNAEKCEQLLTHENEALMEAKSRLEAVTHKSIRGARPPGYAHMVHSHEQIYHKILRSKDKRNLDFLRAVQQQYRRS